eukprot:CAMPEP_0169395918 /NCGR_PEP_ID=MMETSP1017-20121227/50957_1 /TAXON_ID=342587 /ORGANISM="Karlodinium micrum, Strain CCMP2283" /LENGTH=167 /DNA_ID=CAMNT_0009500055 /DNA_START=16 /DNA_END=516 /DNA_ORIENTATION=-
MAGQKMVALRKQQAELLKQQVEMTRAMKKKIGEDIVVQSTCLKSQVHSIKQSRQPGALTYRNGPGPGGEMPGVHGEYDLTLQNFKHLGSTAVTLDKELATLDRNERKALLEQAQSDASVNSMAAWFSRYGSPRRQSHPEETARSCLMKPRRTPGGDVSNAVCLRKGW